MEKAIYITQKMKIDNPELLKGYGHSSISVMKVPKKWHNGNWNCPGDFHKKSQLQLEAGFWDVVDEDYDSDTQYLGEFVENTEEKKFFRYAENFTEEELQLKEQQKLENLPTLASKYADEIGFSYARDIDIPVDMLEIFTPTEKRYNVKGEPVIKEYFKDDIKICSILYNKEYEEITHQGITKNEMVASKTVFRFYKDEEGMLYKEKVMQKLQFKLVPTLVHDEADPTLVVDVLWSSAKREEVLRGERFKADEVMKTFNPQLYYLITQLFEASYARYKETGDKTLLVQELINHTLPKLDEQVLDDDKAVIFGEMENYPSLTIREMIIGALQ